MILSRRQLLQVPAALAVPASIGEVPPLDTSTIRPADFAGDDLDLPYHLIHFARVANSVLLDGPDRGFFGLSVWRDAKDNHPYNARVMENILSLAWFYTAERKWNPYRGHPEVRRRLEAALDFWCRTQNADGRFSEYKPQGWFLPPTAFSQKFVTEALRLLAGQPSISPGLYERAVNACRKAVHAVLHDPECYRQGRSFSNQFTNVFAGGTAFLARYPDEALSAKLHEHLSASSTEFQSPAGYFYEADGPDYSYNMQVHHESVHMAYHYWHGKPEGEILLDQERRFCEWLSYNALPEPGRDFFVLNRSVETRKLYPAFSALDTPLADRCSIARAFATSPERRAGLIRARRRRLEQEWPNLAPLKVGEFFAYSPHIFLSRALYDWHPSAAQIAEARKLLRPVQEESFVHQLKDTRRPVVYTYVRRPAYYAAFASGPAITRQQRFGLTLVWSPRSGVVLQSQTNGAETAWGTAGTNGKPLEAAGVDAEFADGGARVQYPLAGGGMKALLFAGDRIKVSIERPGEIVERLPLFDPGRAHSTHAPGITEQAQSPVPGKKFFVAEFRASGRLEYELR